MSANATNAVPNPTKAYVGAPPNKPVRLSFPSLFTPVERTNEEGKKVSKYEATFLLPPDYDLTSLKQAVMAAAVAEWGQGAIDMIKAGQIKLPFRNQNEKPNVAGYTEGWFITCSTKNRPGVVNENIEPIMDPSELLAGMFVIATVNAYAWTHKMKGKGVSFGLLNVMKAGDDGTRWSSVARPEEDFAQFKSAASSGPSVANINEIF